MADCFGSALSAINCDVSLHGISENSDKAIIKLNSLDNLINDIIKQIASF